jgi:hypothetical protein
VDLDLNTLSNVLRYGVSIGHLPANPVGIGRPRYQATSAVRHAREMAPASADVIHKIASRLFESHRSAALACSAASGKARAIAARSWVSRVWAMRSMESGGRDGDSTHPDHPSQRLRPPQR